MNGGTIVAESFCVRNSGTFTMNGGAIRGNDSLSVGVVNHGQMYANGGTVKDCAQIVLDNYGTVLVDAQASGTEFDGDASNGGPRAATIFGGIFHGNVSNEKDGAISGGTFNGKGHTVKNLFINSGSLQYAGLFGYTKAAALRDLTVSGSVTSTAEDNSVGGIVGMAYGGVTPANAAFVSSYYGMRHYAVNLSVVVTNLLFASFGSTIAGALYDATGSYLSTDAMILVLAVLSAAVSFGIDLCDRRMLKRR